FPIIAEKESLDKFSLSMKEEYDTRSFNEYENLTYLQMSELSYVEKRLLVEKHLVSPYLIKARSSAALISENEQMSVMINEEENRKSTRLNSSHVSSSYAVFCLKKKQKNKK